MYKERQNVLMSKLQKDVVNIIEGYIGVNKKHTYNLMKGVMGELDCFQYHQHNPHWNQTPHQTIKSISLLTEKLSKSSTYGLTKFQWYEICEELLKKFNHERLPWLSRTLFMIKGSPRGWNSYIESLHAFC